ncbi:MAG TPA: prolyl oligopeptidase family serine peptidase [Acidimicrobiales bacterium]|nr:prolyl oligopeptidase family serine peptidase [Acidimicrobiales bacterium]
MTAPRAKPAAGGGERPTLPAGGGEFSVKLADRTLAAYVARPAPSAAGGSGRHGLVLCHGFPADPPRPDSPNRGYQQLADRLAADTGWVVLTFSFRGTSGSTGNFSLGGWLADLQVAIDVMLASDEVDAVWVCGFAAGGALAICAAGEDPRVRGVAAFSAPADFADRATDARRFVAQARAVGVIHDPSFPPDLDEWARELREIRPLNLIGKIPPRSILLVHGANDEVVPVLDARALADAAYAQVELRVLPGAGHRLRNDPRAIALLIGWIDRQGV